MVRLMGMVAVLILLVGVACGNDGDDDGDTGGSATATTVTSVDPTPTAAPEDDEGDDAADIEGDADSGQALAQSSGCIACHTTDGSPLVGPSWQGLWMSEAPLEGGETVTADAAYIRTSILSPNEQVVQGFTPTMPSFQGQLDDQEIADIIAYIQTLE